MYDITQWKNTIESCVTKYALGFSREDKEDLKQDLYLAILEADDKIQLVLSKGTAREGFEEATKLVVILCRDRIKDWQRLSLDSKYGEAGASLSLSDQDVRNEVEKSPVLPMGKKNLKAVSLAVSKLPEQEKTVIKKIFYEGMSDADLAQYLGHSVKWVGKMRKSALSQLETLLKKESK